MSNPLFNMLNGGRNATSNPFSNFADFVNNFNQFKSNLGTNPEQQAEQTVRRMLESGQISQSQFNQVAQIATSIQRATGIK